MISVIVNKISKIGDHVNDWERDYGTDKNKEFTNELSIESHMQYEQTIDDIFNHVIGLHVINDKDYMYYVDIS